jgi:hypothetical protein
MLTFIHLFLDFHLISAIDEGNIPPGFEGAEGKTRNL